MRGAALRAVLHPRVVLPVLLATALFFVAFNLGDLGQVVDRLEAVPIRAMVGVLACALCYLVLKGWQLHLLLRDLDAPVGWRRLVFAFAVGEITLTLPLGVFAQNWLLTGTRRTRFGRTAAATVFMLILEVVIALVWLAVHAIPAWPQVRYVALAVLLAMVLAAGALLWFHLLARLAARIERGRVHRALGALAELLEGLVQLGTWRVLGVNVLVAVCYLAALAAAFCIMGRAMGLHALGFSQAATIYAFTLAAVLVIGAVSGQIGTVEVIGMGVAHAWGLGYTDGLALMLGFRVAWTGAMWLLNGIVVVCLWRSAGPGDRPA